MQTLKSHASQCQLSVLKKERIRKEEKRGWREGSDSNWFLCFSFEMIGIFSSLSVVVVARRISHGYNDCGKRQPIDAKEGKLGQTMTSLSADFHLAYSASV